MMYFTMLYLFVILLLSNVPSALLDMGLTLPCAEICDSNNQYSNPGQCLADIKNNKCNCSDACDLKSTTCQYLQQKGVCNRTNNAKSRTKVQCEDDSPKVWEISSAKYSCCEICNPDNDHYNPIECQIAIEQHKCSCDDVCKLIINVCSTLNCTKNYTSDEPCFVCYQYNNSTKEKLCSCNVSYLEIWYINYTLVLINNSSISEIPKKVETSTISPKIGILVGISVAIATIASVYVIIKKYCKSQDVRYSRTPTEPSITKPMKPTEPAVSETIVDEDTKDTQL